ncbi:unnamed protein product [Caenorhabditis sp. 36 PRJEB53466]|nr:unnamed protein product [Caenorhabditis sp. 36 PRJEB53466]
MGVSWSGCSQRTSSGADVASENEDIITNHTEDSDADSEEDISEEFSLDSDDEIDEEKSENHERAEILQNAIGSFEMSEVRIGGLVRFHSKGPACDRTQDFWQQIIEKRIHTVFMCCDFFKGDERICGQYVPAESRIGQRCGIYTVERIGNVTSLSVNLRRQQLLVYRIDSASRSDYKHHVMHFQQIPLKFKENETEGDGLKFDLNQSARNFEMVANMADRQANPQILLHDSWNSDKILEWKTVE